MDKKTVFVKTDSGESEVAGQSDKLFGDTKRILILVDDESTVGEITKRAPPSLRATLDNVLQELVDGGYIRDMRAPVNVPQKPALKMSTPALKMAAPKMAAPQMAAPQYIPPAPPPPVQKTETKPRSESPVSNGGTELDFSFITSGSGANEEDAKAAKLKAERIKAEQAAQIEATAKAAKLKAYEEAKERAKKEVAARAEQMKAKDEIIGKIEAAAKARIEAEKREKNEAEAARLKVEQEALKARAELEATRARVEAETRARIEAEVKIKREAEAARLKAEREAEIIRLELAAAKAKAEEEIRNRLEAEARAKVEEETRRRREADAERLRMEKERAELELARLKVEAELKMRADAEVRIRAEMDARLKAEELARQRARSSTPLADESQVDPADKLRQTFVNSFAQNKDKHKSSTGNFKLDTFSLSLPLGKTNETVTPKKPEMATGGVSKVKQAIEQRAQREAEAQRIKAEQEAARQKAEQDQADRLQAEQRSARLQEEHKAYQLKVAQEEARAKAEAEAQKLANQQAKQWEEAQHLATVKAQAEKERLDWQAAEAQKKIQQKPRSPRKPLPVGKFVAGLLALALFAVAVLPYIWPLDEYVATLEDEISAQINQPVKIKKISFVLLPLPRLELHNLAIGSGQELKAEDAVLNFDFSALFSPTRSINSLALNKVNLSGASLEKVLGWLQMAGGVEKYPVASMELKSLRVKNDDINIPLFNGSAKFDAQGKFTGAELKSEDGKFSIGLQSLQNRLQLELNVHESSLPILTNYKFKDLSVSGEIVDGQFVFSDFFAHIHGGTLTGKGKLGWSNGWKLESLLNAKSLELQSMFPDFGMTGEVYGDVNVSMHGAALPQLDKDPRMVGTFEAKNGIINKIDIETIARFGTRQGGGGRTNFNELSGNVIADNRTRRFNLNKISAGVVSGSGFVEVDANQQLSGKLMVDISGMARGKIPLWLSGSPTDPQLQAGQ